MAEGCDKKQTLETGDGTENDNMDEPDRIKQCAICLEKFRRPKLLPCFHTFCQSCLQGLAGSSASFPCPSCRTVVRLPPRGVAALQTNFYIEDEGSTHSTHPLCDVCADERDATHSCLQCQQRYCLPCRQYHDSFTLLSGHTVIPLDSGEEEGSGEKRVDVEPVEMCPKHPDQRLFLHCSACQADICLHCKLTLHDGHRTEDLKDVRSKVRDKLKDKMEELKLEVQQIDETVSSLEERIGKIQSQKESWGENCRGRATMLHQWVSQSLEEAEKSLKNSTEQKLKPWQELSEQLRDKKLALQARLEHVSRVLRGGRQGDIVLLDAQLSSGMEGGEGDVMKETLKKMSDDVPSLSIEHSLDAINQQQLSTFIGILESDEEASDSGKSKAKSMEGSDLKSKTDTMSLAISRGVGKKAPREFVYSMNPDAVVYHMCPISGGRLWVMYKWADDHRMTRYLKLFDAEGQVLTTVEFKHDYSNLLPVAGDYMLAWKRYSTDHQLISLDGTVTPFKTEKHVWLLVCSDSGDIHYLIFCSKNKHYVYDWDYSPVCKGNFFLTESTDQNNSTQSAESGSQPSITPPSKRQLKFVELFKSSKDYSPHRVSAGGKYFVFLSPNEVEVYTPDADLKLTLVCLYKTQKEPTDARVCTINGREMLLVMVSEDDRIHLVELSEGGYFVGYLNTGPLKLDRSCCMAVDSKNIWIGCRGGKVVMMDL